MHFFQMVTIKKTACTRNRSSIFDLSFNFKPDMLPKESSIEITFSSTSSSSQPNILSASKKVHIKNVKYKQNLLTFEMNGSFKTGSARVVLSTNCKNAKEIEPKISFRSIKDSGSVTSVATPVLDDDTSGKSPKANVGSDLCILYFIKIQRQG